MDTKGGTATKKDLERLKGYLERIPEDTKASQGSQPRIELSSEMKQLQKLSCLIIAMFATLTTEQIALLQQDYMHGDNIVILTKGVHRENLKLQVQRYKRRKQIYNTDEAIDSEDDEPVSMTTTASLWEAAMHKLNAVDPPVTQRK